MAAEPTRVDPADGADDDAPGAGGDGPHVAAAELSRRLAWVQFRTAIEYLVHNSPASHRLVTRAAKYPAPFGRTTLRGFGGAGLPTVVAFHEAPAPLVVFVPGTFNTKDTVATRTKVSALFTDHGVHVAALDLRGFGSGRRRHSTGGVAEALDLVEVAATLRRDERVTSVAFVGESLGASACIVAAGHPSRPADRVLAWSPFADLGWAARWVSTAPPAGHAFRQTYHAFRTLLRHVTTEHADRFDSYLDLRARRHGLTLDHVAAAAGPRHVVGALPVPTLIVHAEDDPVVPPFHARVLAMAARHNANVEVRLVPTGAHAFFDVADRAWYDRVTAAFLAPLGGPAA